MPAALLPDLTLYHNQQWQKGSTDVLIATITATSCLQSLRVYPNMFRISFTVFYVLAYAGDLQRSVETGYKNRPTVHSVHKVNIPISGSSTVGSVHCVKVHREQQK